MPTIYCPNTQCAAEVHYSGSKPTVCPQCKQPFSAAFQGVAAAKAVPTSVAPHRRAIPALSKLKQRPKTLAPHKDEPPAAATFMMPIGMSAADEALLPQIPQPDIDSADEYEDDSEPDPTAVSELANEIKASLNEKDIIVSGDPDEWGVRLQRPKQ